METKAEIIERLKKNTVAYGLLSDADKKVLMSTESKDLIEYGRDFKDMWAGIASTSLFFRTTYRIKADYNIPEPEPEYVEYPIIEAGGVLFYSRGTEAEVGIGNLAALVDFVGFKYANGKITATPRVFGTKCDCFYYHGGDANIIYDLVVHTPTYVVFRKET